MRWYMTIRAVNEFQGIVGLPVESDGPAFDRAERELASVCDDAWLLHAMGEASNNAAVYRSKLKIHGRVAVLDLNVAENPRPEGPLPQLVRVRRKR